MYSNEKEKKQLIEAEGLRKLAFIGTTVRLALDKGLTMSKLK